MVRQPPRKKLYKTMQGKMVDIDKLRAANENVQAVGNMNVNAKGDVLGAGGKIVTPKETVIKKYYEQPKGMVSDTPSKGKAMPAPKVEAVKPVASKPAPKKAVAPQPKKAQSTAKKGIDAALDGLE